MAKLVKFKPPKQPKQQQSVQRLTPGQVNEIKACGLARGVEGFHRFCHRHVKIQERIRKDDLKPGQAEARDMPFVWFPGQARLSVHLVNRVNLIILKGRQLGVTWLVAAYTLWRMIFSPAFVGAAAFQKLEYSGDFIWRIRFMHERLPPYMAPALTKKDTLRINFYHGLRDIRAVWGEGGSVRSLTGDVMIYDEAPLIRGLKKSMQGTKPALETTGGHVVVLGTSEGPAGDYYDLWQETFGEYGELVDPETNLGPNNMMPFFMHWSERPGRDQKWYEAQKLELGDLGVKREYPNDEQEAFEFAGGRCHPQFTRQDHVGQIRIPRDAKRYFAIDWGFAESAYVVLWIAHIKEHRPGFMIHPDCTHAIREMLSYRLDSDPPHWPLDENKHCPDAIRYAIVTFNLTGMVYVYREVWRNHEQDRDPKYHSLLYKVGEVAELSGWDPAPRGDRRFFKPGDRAEFYDLENPRYGPPRGVADRSWPDSVATFTSMGFRCLLRKVLTVKERGKDKSGKARTELLEGIRRVNVLIDARYEIDKALPVEKDKLLFDEYRRGLIKPTSKRLNEQDAYKAARKLWERANKK